MMACDGKKMASHITSQDTTLQRVLSLASPVLQGPLQLSLSLVPIIWSTSSAVTSAMHSLAFQALGAGPAMWLLPALYVSRVKFGTSANHAGLKALHRAAKIQPLGPAAATRLARTRARAQVVRGQQAHVTRSLQRGKLHALTLSAPFSTPQLVCTAAPAAAAAAQTRDWMHAAAGLQASML